MKIGICRCAQEASIPDPQQLESGRKASKSELSYPDRLIANSEFARSDAHLHMPMSA
jgi:hypothetical protein